MRPDTDLSTIAYAATRTAELAARVRDLAVMQSVQAPGSTAWKDLSDDLDNANASWLAWSSEGSTMATLDLQLRANRAQIQHTKAARSPWPAAAGVTGGAGLLLGVDWLLFAPAAWLPISALACAAAAAGSVLLTGQARRAAAARVTELRHTRSELVARRDEVIARYRQATRSPDPVSYAGTAVGGGES
jgi:hypothetical protein